MESEKRCCKYCDHVLAGRPDKTFCNAACRNAYHNQNPLGYNKQVRPIFMTLKRNRKILIGALEKTKGAVIEFHELVSMGYTHRYCTEHKQLNNEDYYFCFDVGFKLTENFHVSVLTREQFEFISKPLPTTTWQLVNRNEGEDRSNRLGKNR